jgi:anti-sigma factor RsiW
MNCSDCQEQLTAFTEGLLEPQAADQVAQHLQACPACRTEASAQRQLRDRLLAGAGAFAGRSFEAAVLDRIDQQRASRDRRITMLKRYGRAGVGLAAAVAIAAVLFTWGSSSGSRATAAEIFAQAIQATSSLKSVYLKLNVRTSPNDNFMAVSPDYEFVTQEMWKQFGDAPKWRVEKSGRVAVMDGTFPG